MSQSTVSLKRLTQEESVNPDPMSHLGKTLQAIALQVDRAPRDSDAQKTKIQQWGLVMDTVHAISPEAAIALTRMQITTMAGRGNSPLNEIASAKLSSYKEMAAQTEQQSRQVVESRAAHIRQALDQGATDETGRIQGIQYVRRRPITDAVPAG